MNFKRFFYEYHCWTGYPAIGFYRFLREIKGISYRLLNLFGIVDDETAEEAAQPTL